MTENPQSTCSACIVGPRVWLWIRIERTFRLIINFDCDGYHVHVPTRLFDLFSSPQAISLPFCFPSTSWCRTVLRPSNIPRFRSHIILGLNPVNYTLHINFDMGGWGEEEIVIPTKQVVWIISLNYMGIFRRSDAYQSYLSQLLSPRTQEAHGFGVFCWEHCRLWRLNALFFSGDVEMSLLFLFLRNLMVFFHNFIFFYLLSIISSRLDQFLAIFLGSKNSNVL